MPLDIRLVSHRSRDYLAAVDLRRAVLRTPLGLDFTADQLAGESADTHFAAFDGGRLAGAVVMTPCGETTVKLRQMAVAPDAQGKGVGSALLRAFETHARANGVTAIALAARLTARDFYERHGYAAEGVVFEEVTLPHIRMGKRL